MGVVDSHRSCAEFAVDDAAKPSEPIRPTSGSYFWFYRSGFKDYDRHAIAIERWIHRLMSWTVQYRDLHRSSWRHRTGFMTYDEIGKGHLKELAEYRSFVDFATGLDTFAADLDHCSLAQ